MSGVSQFEKMNPLDLITDTYDRQARLYPALLLVAPLVLTVVALFSAQLSFLQELGAYFLGFGGAFLLTELARDAGKKRESFLFARWGGVPSVTIFRHRDLRLDALTKSRYHKSLAQLVDGTRAPTIQEEAADPTAADAVYTAWSNYLRVKARDDPKNFPQVFKENVSFGYRRNVWGLRRIGITVALLSVLGCGGQLYLVRHTTGALDVAVAGAGMAAAIFTLLWLLRFTADWVRVPGDAYAQRLAESVDVLAREARG